MPAQRDEPSALPQAEIDECLGIFVAPRGRPDGSSPPLGRGMSHPYGAAASSARLPGKFPAACVEFPWGMW